MTFSSSRTFPGKEYETSGRRASDVNLRSGRPTRLPPPVAGYAERLPPQHRAVLDGILSAAAVGSPDTVRGRLQALRARTDADELIVTSQIYDHAARLRSFEIAAGLQI